MNTSIIMQMIRDDPSIPDDITGFLKRMNEQNIEQVVKSHGIVVDETLMFSIAELNGGPATDRDVLDSLALIKAEPLHDEAKERFEKLSAIISSGNVKDSAELKQAFVDAILDVKH